MATIPNTPLIPTSPSTSEDTQTLGTDLDEVNTEDEMNMDTSIWSDKERKKLQHMTERNTKEYLVIRLCFIPSSARELHI